jgi:hypothetical protein
MKLINYRYSYQTQSSAKAVGINIVSFNGENWFRVNDVINILKCKSVDQYVRKKNQSTLRNLYIKFGYYSNKNNTIPESIN